MSTQFGSQPMSAQSVPQPADAPCQNWAPRSYDFNLKLFRANYPSLKIEATVSQDWFKDGYNKIHELEETPLIAIDIETAGAGFRHWLVSLGYAIFTPHDKKIVRRTINMPIACLPRKFHPDMKLAGWEDRCIREFWSKQSPELLDQLRHPDTSTDVDALGSREQYIKYKGAVQEAIEQLRACIEKMPSEPIIVSDNPEFDLGRINYEIDRYNDGSNPLRYSEKYGYLTVTDVGDFLAMLDKGHVKDLLAENKEFAHTHNPGDDAAMMLHKFRVALELKKAALPLTQVIVEEARSSLKRKAMGDCVDE